jgi:hypothetical protein
LFSGVDISWGRVPNSENVAKGIQQAIAGFDPLNPESAVPYLIEVHRALTELPTSFWQSKKLEDLGRVIAACLALDVESIATQASAVPGSDVSIGLHVIQRSSLPITIAFASTEAGLSEATVYDLKTNQLLNVSNTNRIAEDSAISQPYWLRAAAEKGSYVVDELNQIGDPENPSALPAYLKLSVAGYPITFEIPTTYNFNDPINGETKLPFTVTPPVMVNLEERTHILGQSEPRTFNVRVIARTVIPSGTVHFEVSNGWSVEPASISFSAEAGEELLLTSQLIPPAEAGETTLRASVQLPGQDGQVGRSYTRGYAPLDYDHIPHQVLFPVAEARGVLLDVKTAGHRIGYIPGAGDTIPEALQRIGYTVDTLTEADMTYDILTDYDTVVFGIRALNTNDRIGFYMPALFEYAERGGVVVLQYNTNRSLKTMDYAPYPFTITRGRVTDETAEMRFLAPNHRVMHFPNTITAADFEGWVQERGLYFADDWDAAYTPIFSANDANESPLDGGLLIAQIGKGYFVYSGLSWFRQFPAGVPGAYRIFANLMSLGQVSE